MPLPYICATSPSSWSFTDSTSLLFLSLRSKPPRHLAPAAASSAPAARRSARGRPRDLFILLCRFAPNRQGTLLRLQLLLLLLHAARRVGGLATYLFFCVASLQTAKHPCSGCSLFCSCCTPLGASSARDLIIYLPFQDRLHRGVW